VGGGHCPNDHISTSNGFGFIVLWSIGIVIGEKTGEPGGHIALIPRPHLPMGDGGQFFKALVRRDAKG